MAPGASIVHLSGVSLGLGTCSLQIMLYISGLCDPFSYVGPNSKKSYYSWYIHMNVLVGMEKSLDQGSKTAPNTVSCLPTLFCLPLIRRYIALLQVAQIFTPGDA